ncbi:MAG: 30S ribosomal protein S16 [Bacteroidales bacterium]|nr:30S ribosomal protein S16 [Bacteroidales bacterium]
MAVRLRLQRHGKKGRPFYHIVAADGRAPRDGKLIEKIGTYNPVTNPAEVVLDVDKAVNWLRKGAQPTDTVRSILSFKGVLYRNHLLKGVDKGALTQEQADARYNAWLEQKEAKHETKIKDANLSIKEAEKKRFEEETKIKETRAAAIAKRKKEQLEKLVAEIADAGTEETETEEIEVRTPEGPPKEEVKAEPEAKVKSEAPVTEEKTKKSVPEEKTEKPVAEEKTKESAPEEKAAEPVAVEPVAEKKAEEPKEKTPEEKKDK